VLDRAASENTARSLWIEREQCHPEEAHQPDRLTSEGGFKKLSSRPYVISKKAPHRTIGWHEILHAD
jgi:hypothetical protein